MHGSVYARLAVAMKLVYLSTAQQHGCLGHHQSSQGPTRDGISLYRVRNGYRGDVSGVWVRCNPSETGLWAGLSVDERTGTVRITGHFEFGGRCAGATGCARGGSLRGNCLQNLHKKGINCFKT